MIEKISIIILFIIIISFICILFIVIKDYKRRSGLFIDFRFNKSKDNKLNTSSINYDVYNMSFKEKIAYISIYTILTSLVSFVFYRSFIIAILLIPISIIFLRIKTKQLIKKRRLELNFQFTDALYSVSSSLMSGKSIEKAMETSLEDLQIQYQDSNTLIIREMKLIVHKLKLNEPLESALTDLAIRTKLEDIENFVDVIIACKKTGGDLVQVIKSTTDLINSKIYINQEIENLTIKRRLEQRILSIMPIALMWIISSSSGDFINPVYTTIQGRVAMTISILLFALAYFISYKIMDIEV